MLQKRRFFRHILEQTYISGVAPKFFDFFLNFLGKTLNIVKSVTFEVLGPKTSLGQLRPKRHIKP